MPENFLAKANGVSPAYHHPRRTAYGVPVAVVSQKTSRAQADYRALQSFRARPCVPLSATPNKAFPKRTTNTTRRPNTTPQHTPERQPRFLCDERPLCFTLFFPFRFSTIYLRNTEPPRYFSGSSRTTLNIPHIALGSPPHAAVIVALHGDASSPSVLSRVRWPAAVFPMFLATKRKTFFFSYLPR